MNWQFTLIDYTNNPLGVATIIDEPSGWDGITISMRRDMDMHGIFFEFTQTSLTFYGLGFGILRDAYATNNVEAKVEIDVKYLCSEGDSFADFYYGRLVFTKFTQNCNDICSITIPSEQADAVMTFKNRIDQSVNLGSLEDFSGNELVPYNALAFPLTLDSKAIYKRTDRQATTTVQLETCNYVENAIPLGAPGNYTQRDWTAYYTPAFDSITHDEVGSWVGVDQDFDSIQYTPATIVIEEDGIYNLETEINAKINAWAFTGADLLANGGVNGGFNNIDIYVHIVINEAITNTIYTINDNSAYCRTQKASACDPKSLVPTVPMPFGNHDWGVNTGVYTNTYSLKAGDRMAIAVEIHQGGQYEQRLTFRNYISFTQWINFYGNDTATPCYFKINCLSTAPTTNTNVFAINESFARITEAITGSQMSFYSEYFGRTDSEPIALPSDGCGSLEAITNGLLIRGQKITNNTFYFTCHFLELFNAMNCIHNIGAKYYEGTINGNDFKGIVVEPVEAFYQSNVIIFYANDVASLIRTPIQKMYYSKVEFGYAKYEAEDFTGIDEYFSKREYKTELSQTKNTDSKLCQFIASGYALEVTRRQSNFDTKDWKYDNDKFIICLKRGGENELIVDLGNMSLANNVIDPPTTYNNIISPIRNGMRWFKTWAAQMADPLTNKITFSSAFGNYFAEFFTSQPCPLEVGAIGENQDLGLNLFDSPTANLPLWKPEQIKFDYPLSLTDYLDLKTNPYGIIKFNCIDGVDDYGYIMDIEYRPNEGMATFTLLKALIP
jgi:hypothetical protein